MTNSEEQLHEVTVTVEYSETFDHESSSIEQTEEFAKHIVAEDIAQGDIPVDAMTIEAEAREL